MRAAGKRRYRHVTEVGGVGRGVELADESHAGMERAFGADQHGSLLAPRGFAVHLPCLAEDAREGESAERVTAAIVTGDERSVESTHQNVIPDGGGVAQ